MATKMTITGIPSGDLECWCLLVDRATFIELDGVEPDERYDVGHFAKEGSPYRYKIYPSHFIPREYGDPKEAKPVTFTIEVHG